MKNLFTTLVAATLLCACHSDEAIPPVSKVQASAALTPAPLHAPSGTRDVVAMLPETGDKAAPVARVETVSARPALRTAIRVPPLGASERTGEAALPTTLAKRAGDLAGTRPGDNPPRRAGDL